MFERGWQTSAQDREILEQAANAYKTWYDWVPANDKEGECLDQPMRKLGKALKSAGMDVPEPFLEEDDQEG